MAREGAGGIAAGGQRASVGEQIGDQRWRHVPLALFTIPMSFVGLGLALRRAATTPSMPALAPDATARLADLVLLGSFLSLAIIFYALAHKLFRHPDQLRADLSHPVRICFAAALPMTLVLQAAAALPHMPGLAHALWLIGTVLYGTIAVWAVAVWQHRAPVDLAALNPIWFLPIVGHVLVAHCGAKLGYVETSWLVVGLSLPLWILVQTLLFYRNVFSSPLPPRLLPTLTIQIGPAPLIFLALAELQTGLDTLMRITFYAGVGTLLVLWLPRLPQFLRLPFAMPHWAFSFPFSALSASVLVYADRASSPGIWTAGLISLLVPLATTSTLLLATMKAWRKGAFAQPEP